MSQTKSSKSMSSTKNIVLVGMFAAVLAVISQLSIPMPSGVPITIQLFGIALVGSVLGWKLGFLATLVYILLGSIGLPIFANFQGGVHVLVGFSGGYIWAWPAMALLCGINPKAANNKAAKLIISIVLTIIGVLIVEFIGGLWWSHLSSDQSFGAIIIYSFTAFIPKDIIISVVGIMIGKQIQKLLLHNGLITL